LTGKPEGRRQLGRPRRRWEANIVIILRETGRKDVDWIRLSAVVGSCDHGNGVSVSIKGRKFLE
jgi:hypothetical protein